MSETEIDWTRIMEMAMGLSRAVRAYVPVMELEASGELVCAIKGKTNRVGLVSLAADLTIAAANSDPLVCIKDNGRIDEATGIIQFVIADDPPQRIQRKQMGWFDRSCAAIIGLVFFSIIAFAGVGVVATFRWLFS